MNKPSSVCKPSTSQLTLISIIIHQAFNNFTIHSIEPASLKKCIIILLEILTSAYGYSATVCSHNLMNMHQHQYYW